MRVLGKQIKVQYVLGGVLVYIGGTYAALRVFSPSTKSDGPALKQLNESEIISDVDRLQRFSAIAEVYDRIVENDETWNGIQDLRRQIIGTYANGAVLEVGAGTGRNLPFYRFDKISRITFTDAVESMAHVLKAKVDGLVAEQRDSPAAVPAMVVKVADAQSLTNSLGAAQFDTAVDSFGLCSYSDPNKVLQELICAVRPGGRVCLLEHGRSHSIWPVGTIMNYFLDKRASRHAEHFGCWYNRDIKNIVETAMLTDSQFQVVESGSKHFGTTYWWVFEKKPSR